MIRFLCGTVLVLGISMIFSCTYKNADTVYPSGTCDTTSVSYSRDIQPILSNNCYSCHSEANKGLGNNVVLDNHTDLSTQAKSGFLVTDIHISDINSISHMPRSAPSLSDCNINKITAWVNQGYKNN